MRFLTLAQESFDHGGSLRLLRHHCVAVLHSSQSIKRLGWRRRRKGEDAFISEELKISLYLLHVSFLTYVNVRYVGVGHTSGMALSNISTLHLLSEVSESYMDIKSPSKKAPEELSRELLIAISDCLPDKILDSDIVTESDDADGFGRPIVDWDDKFRSELISISYVESPDVKI
ncbi:hypothetical protein VNO80_09699 [Phaseolus coccineus]|uniref:Uncharacterized protein n=1 Tax=Phaseolus coccineus TaxID=3886 RepID=A0AAN9N7A5_PHACN